MPNIKSAVKRVKTSEKSRARNNTDQVGVENPAQEPAGRHRRRCRRQDPGGVSRLLLRPRQGRQARHHPQEYGHPEEIPLGHPSSQESRQVASPFPGPAPNPPRPSLGMRGVFLRPMPFVSPAPAWRRHSRPRWLPWRAGIPACRCRPPSARSAHRADPPAGASTQSALPRSAPSAPAHPPRRVSTPHPPRWPAAGAPSFRFPQRNSPASCTAPTRSSSAFSFGSSNGPRDGPGILRLSAGPGFTPAQSPATRPRR